MAADPPCKPSRDLESALREAATLHGQLGVDSRQAIQTAAETLQTTIATNEQQREQLQTDWDNERSGLETQLGELSQASQTREQELTARIQDREYSADGCFA